MITHDHEYYTVREAAEALRVSVPTVWRWIRSGRLKAYRVGKRSVRIRNDALDLVKEPLEGPTRQNPDEIIARLRELHSRILARRGGRPLPSSVPIIRQMREERSERL